MGCRRRLLTRGVCALVLGSGLLGVAAGQQTQPTPTTEPADELPPQVRQLLDEVEDFTFNFDYPGYYALLEYVKASALAPGHSREPAEIDDWRTLLKQPSDFRGEPITIAGVVARNKDPYTHKRYRELGQVWQVELTRRDQPVTCTVIFTNDVGDLPIDATIRVTGYFVKINKFPTQKRGFGLSILLVSPGPSLVSRAAPVTAKSKGLDWRWLIAALALGLLIVWVVLRRSTSKPLRRDPHSLHARRAAPMNLADDLAEWSEQQAPDDDDAGQDQR